MCMSLDYLTSNPVPAPITFLAISASTSVCCVLLDTPTQQYHWQTAQSNQHSEQLLPAIQNLLQQAGLTQVDCIAVDIGPGAFTSVRVACAVAQGLALGWGCGVLMVESLTALAYQHQQHQQHQQQHTQTTTQAHTLVLTVLDARMNECYAAMYHVEPHGHVTQTLPARLIPYDLQGFDAVYEHVIGNMADILPQWNVMGAAQTSAQPLASGVLMAAKMQLAHGVLPVLPEHILPLYVRNQVAFTTAERLAQLNLS